MRVRKRYLPPGWYPSGAKQIHEAIEHMLRETRPGPPSAVAGIAPHAGWEFSGAIALGVFSRILRSIDLIVIIGGHLGPSDGILCAFEEGYETPLGTIEADMEILEALRGRITLEEDRYADNTVEIQLPFIRHFFPGTMALAMRASPSHDAVRLGKELADVAAQKGRRLAVIGSTDLTHYGTNYGFQPAGMGERALKWVRDVNDRRFVESCMAMDAEAAIERSLKERSACSAGGAVAAMTFARAVGSEPGRLVKYMTSYEVHPSDSFVGYAGVVYPMKDSP